MQATAATSIQLSNSEIKATESHAESEPPGGTEDFPHVPLAQAKAVTQCGGWNSSDRTTEELFLFLPLLFPYLSLL